ncbi:hypothetical protein MiSe_29400 [Microseira wollei NIES-4236]|uniref:Uncharacterized protein n=2 Tax=Microseira wollei TaxID=467598 RepID=A0AAV3XC17_9CYAN|nr:hypothetical protein [Microseira wollei]GET38186.1 hypothetical protein MiSe_29400 [Microseira wollei NIES-4236]
MYAGDVGDDRQEKTGLDDSTRGVQAEGEPDANPIQYSEARSLSGTDEYKSERIDRALGEGHGRKRGTANIGKMLRQLRQIRQAHLAYVEAHGQRLEARLKENREHHQKILGEINDLEDELTKLLEEFEEEEASS